MTGIRLRANGRASMRTRCTEDARCPSRSEQGPATMAADCLWTDLAWMAQSDPGEARMRFAAAVAALPLHAAPDVRARGYSGYCRSSDCSTVHGPTRGRRLRPGDRELLGRHALVLAPPPRDSWRRRALAMRTVAEMRGLRCRRPAAGAVTSTGTRTGPRERRSIVEYSFRCECGTGIQAVTITEGNSRTNTNCGRQFRNLGKAIRVSGCRKPRIQL